MGEQKIPVPLSVLSPGDILTFNLLVYVNNKYILYKKSGDVVTQDLINKSIRHHSDDRPVFFVEKPDLVKYQKLVRTKLVSQEEVTKFETEFLSVSSQSIVENIFNEQTNSLESFENSRIIVEVIVNKISNDPKELANVLQLLRHDYYTYNHSLDVSAYAIAFANQLVKEKILKPDQKIIESFGHSGLLHDIGKKEISSEIINKKGPLNNEEWALMKRHPEFGTKILTELKINNQIIIQGVKSHHEQVDGSGYPDKLKNNNIPLVAKVISICDVFDAITTKRSYSDVTSPEQTLALMKQEMPGKFDTELLTIFEKKIYPIISQTVKKIQLENFSNTSS